MTNYSILIQSKASYIMIGGQMVNEWADGWVNTLWTCCTQIWSNRGHQGLQ